jgi:hypothetical protein
MVWPGTATTYTNYRDILDVVLVALRLIFRILLSHLEEGLVCLVRGTSIHTTSLLSEVLLLLAGGLL